MWTEQVPGTSGLGSLLAKKPKSSPQTLRIPSYHRDIAHQCAKCDFYHLSKPEWLAPKFTPADLQTLEDAEIEMSPRLDEHFRCCICGSVMRDGIEFLIMPDGSVRCTQDSSRLPEA